MGKGVSKKLQQLAAMLTAGISQLFQRGESVLTSHASSSKNLLADYSIDLRLLPKDYLTTSIWPLSGCVDFNVVMKFEDVNLRKGQRRRSVELFKKMSHSLQWKGRKFQTTVCLPGLEPRSPLMTRQIKNLCPQIQIVYSQWCGSQPYKEKNKQERTTADPKKRITFMLFFPARWNNALFLSRDVQEEIVEPINK